MSGSFKNIGLIDVDGHNFVNFALMKISSFYKSCGVNVEMAKPLDLFNRVHYDVIYASKVFTFSNDFDQRNYDCDQFVLGGTGYDIKSRLPMAIEECRGLDYSIYPNCDYSVQFYSRGCIRRCPFCLVFEKEGKIIPVTPHDLNPNGKWIEVLDNNFFASPNWQEAGTHLLKCDQPVRFHGVDARLLDADQCALLSKLRLMGLIHVAWDMPKMDIQEQLKLLTRFVKSSRICCYILIGFNTTREYDLMRARTLKSLGMVPFAQAYRDYSVNRSVTQYERDFMRWCNNRFLFKSCDFMDYQPRKGFKCSSYFE